VSGGHGDVRAYLKVLWRWKLLIVAIVGFLPAAAYAWVSEQPKTYESSVLLQVQPLTVDTSLFNANAPAPQAQTLLSAARLITTTGVAQAAAAELREPRSTAGTLLGQISAAADVEADFVTILARAPSGLRAARVANAFAAAVVTTRAEQAVGQVNATITNVEDQLGKLARSDVEGRRQLSEQLQRLRALRAAQGSNARIVEPAVASSAPVSPKVGRTVVLSGVVALMLAFGAVVLAQGADRKIRDPLEIEELTDRPLLGAVPASAFGDLQTGGVGEEAFQTLRASLTYFNIDRPIESVLITSPSQGDGKTTVATNLARAMARAGKDVILVDADLRRPQVASRFHVHTTAGLGGVLVEEVSLHDAFVELDPEDSGGGRLRALPAGPPPPNPSELLASERMQNLLDELAGMSDLVIIDSTPLLTVSDSLPLIEFVSGVVAVARLNTTSKDAVRRLELVIANARGILLGCVVTGAATTGLYGDYGGYGYSPRPEPNGNPYAGRRPARPAPRDAPRSGRGHEERPERRDPGSRESEMRRAEAREREQARSADRPRERERDGWFS
jgi:capsular exopolysaccharide synthesis family protein